MNSDKLITESYEIAKEHYAELGINTDLALEKMDKISISIHCWQADDITGFEHRETSSSSGGIRVTGNYPGRARTIDEVRQDLEKVYSLLAGCHRLNLHAIYGDFQNKNVDRDEIEPRHFQSWIDWAKSMNIGIDFNCTCFAHPMADSDYTLSSKDDSVRKFWIDHVKRCRSISNFIGAELGERCIHNIWIPDGSKDITVDRYLYRSILKESLDEVFAEDFPAGHMADSLESKLFGIGSEAFVVGSHEFYLSYAIVKHKLLCLDIGHFHPTESCADKVSAIMQFQDELLFHITRGLRWDSDHIVVLDDPVRSLMQEIVWSDKLDHVLLALDFFDGSVNRIGAYVTGTRATQKALLLALLDPIERLRQYENNGQLFQRLAILEEVKSMPFGAVWDFYCLQHEVPIGTNWVRDVERYEREVLSKR